jgi:hypothetical protein
MAEMQMREMAVCACEIECNRSAGFAGILLGKRADGYLCVHNLISPDELPGIL